MLDTLFSEWDPYRAASFIFLYLWRQVFLRDPLLGGFQWGRVLLLKHLPTIHWQNQHRHSIFSSASLPWLELRMAWWMSVTGAEWPREPMHRSWNHITRYIWASQEPYKPWFRTCLCAIIWATFQMRDQNPWDKDQWSWSFSNDNWPICSPISGRSALYRLSGNDRRRQRSYGRWPLLLPRRVAPCGPWCIPWGLTLAEAWRW